MKAIILAAGYGTRLYPLTKNRPKMLLPIGGKAMIDHIVENLNGVAAISDYYVVTNDRFHAQMSDWAESCPATKPIRVINDGTVSNEDRLGAIDDIRYVLGEGEIVEEHLVVAGDNLFDFNLNDFVSFYRKEGTAAIALKDMAGSPLISQYSVVALDDNDRVTRFEEKPANPKTSLVSICLYIFPADNRSLIDKYMLEGNNPDAPGYYIEWLYNKRDVYGWVFTDSWFDIGDIDSYDEANTLYSDRSETGS
ncbi:nucleotidyltransferase family protein [Planctomycetota bacterium]